MIFAVKNSNICGINALSQYLESEEKISLQKVAAGQLEYYRFDQWSDVRHGIFTRNGGFSDAPWSSLNMGGNVGDKAETVGRNHALMYEALHLPSERACSVWQVHGSDVIAVNRPAKGRRWLALADAMITDCPDTPLVMRFADCTPILLYDQEQGVIAMAHAGWRGTVLGVAANTVRTMVKRFGCKPQNIHAGIGPSIGPARYQVGDEVVQSVYNYFGTLDGLINCDSSGGEKYFNLWAANELDLRQVGVECVEVAGICTAENIHEFFSHRAERGRTGRFGVVMSL